MNGRSSVVRLDADTARIARVGQDGVVFRRSLVRGSDTQATFFARIVEEVAGLDQVIVLGPDAVRLAFEREYVEISHQPDRIVDVPA